MRAMWMPNETPCTPDELRRAGIHSETFDLKATAPALARIKAQRKMPRDEIVDMTVDNPKHEAAIAKEADEHAHVADEVRLILEGDVVYDVRADDDRWMKLTLRAGEIAVIPAKRYHRFLLTGNAVKYQQIFSELGALMPFYRVSNDETRAV